MSERIGFVGVGRMGGNMARRLKDCGHEITAVYDIDAAAAASLAKETGARASSTLAGVTAASDIVVTVVTNDAAMRSIFTDSDDNLLTQAEGRIFINCATLSPAIHVEIESLAAAKGASTLEACMASSIPQAREGTLYLMVGGNESVYERVKPILDDMSESLRYVGTAGKAAEVKALVNMVMNINTAALAEGLGLGHALGLDSGMLQEVFSQTGANSRVLETDGEDMENRDHECYFSCEHAAKDSGIAVELSRQQRLNLPLNEATKAQYDRLVAENLGHLDKSGIAEITFPDRHLAGH